MPPDELVYDTLKGLVDSRVYPVIALGKVKYPYITYHQVGGSSINFLKQEIPNKKNFRFQINIWAKTYMEAQTIAHQAEDALRMNADLQTTVIGTHTVVYEPETQLHGTRQDFYFWT